MDVFDGRLYLAALPIGFQKAGVRVLGALAQLSGNSLELDERYSLGAGATVTLHTGCGSDSDADFYRGSGSAVWNNGGDTVFVTNAEGDTVLQEEYT